eukprot:851157-Pleurochrysis_carterae.AAC.1
MCLKFSPGNVFGSRVPLRVKVRLSAGLMVMPPWLLQFRHSCVRDARVDLWPQLRTRFTQLRARVCSRRRLRVERGSVSKSRSVPRIALAHPPFVLHSILET